jgi:hypothetical protein
MLDKTIDDEPVCACACVCVCGGGGCLKIATSTVEVHSVWHNMYLASETGGQMRSVVYYSVLLLKREGRTPRCTNIITIGRI